MAQKSTVSTGKNKKNISKSSNTSGRGRGRPRKTNPSVIGNTNKKTKNTRQSGRGGSNTAENSNSNVNVNSIALNIMPFILIIISVYLLVSFFLNGAESVGIIGFLSRNIFYGLLGSVAILVPFIMASIAIFLKKDIKSGFFKYRMIFSVICIILYASIFHLASLHSGEKITYSSLEKIFDDGINSIGGGIFGGYLAETLCQCVGPIGAWIFALPLSVVFSTFLFGYTPAGMIKSVIKFISDYRTDKNGFERNIIVKTQDPEHRFKSKTHRYKITSHVNIPVQNDIETGSSQKDVPVDPYDSLKDIKKRKKSKIPDINVSGNLFSNSFTDETEDILNNILNPEQNKDANADSAGNAEIQRSYETPLMLPDSELFGSGDNRTDKDVEELFSLIDGDVNIDVKADKDFDGFENDLDNIIKIIDSAPQARDDEPDMVENGTDKKSINFETTKMFEEDIPVKKEYKLPPISYLTKDTSTTNVDISDELHTTAQKLIDTLASFGVKARIHGHSRGPSITRYAISPEAGVKVSSIVQRVDDISLNLAAEVRIEAPIPGMSAIGVEVPNKIREIVHLRSLLEEPQFKNAASRITIVLGKDVAGKPIYSDIAKMPHLLIAGATGSGKSVCMNALIISILYKATPDEVKMILIDPKKVELNVYNGIPHLLVPIVSDPKKAAGALAWAVNEMENRYMLIEEKGVRDFRAYNEAIAGDPLSEPLPQIVIIIDELADLMLTAPADVEQSVNRLAAKARAAGMHLIVATQRPSVDVITGLIKANIPTRIAFTVVAPQDSRTIINMGGAEKLIGLGDMLYVPTGSKPIRVQGAWVSDPEVLSVIEFWKKQFDGQYNEDVFNEIEQEAARCNTKGSKLKDKDEEINIDEALKKDSMLDSAIELAFSKGYLSTSMMQSEFGLGYPRAAKITSTIEKMGIIGPQDGSKRRNVIMTRQEYAQRLNNNNNSEIPGKEDVRYNKNIIKPHNENKDENKTEEEEFQRDLNAAIKLAVSTGDISPQLLQNKLSLGYMRASQIIATMEKMNIIGPFEGSKPRKVLITKQDFIEMTMNKNDFE